jgi:hypothetical protein
MKKLLDKYNNIIQKTVSWLKQYHLQLIVASLILVAIYLIAAGVLFCQQKWDSYSTNNSQLVGKTKLEVKNAILKLATVTDVNRKTEMGKILQIQSTLSNQVKSFCEVDASVAWQRFVDKYSEKIFVCTQQKLRTQQLLDRLGKIINYIDSESELAIIIFDANLGVTQSNQSDKWNQIEGFWRKASASVLKIKNAYRFKETKDAAIVACNGMADAWSSISKANESKNRQQFETARQGLGGAYAALSNVSGVSTAQLDKIILELNNYLM